MNGYNQSGGQLPVDPINAQIPMPQVGPNNPVAVPNYNFPQELGQYLTLLSTRPAEIIVQNFTKNALRMFMFNRYAINHFSNQPYAELVIGLAQWVDMVMRRGYRGDVAMCIQELAPLMVEMVCCAALKEFPQLETYLSPQEIQVAYGQINAYHEIGSQIAAFNEQRRSNYGQVQQGGGGRGGSWAMNQVMGGGGAMGMVGGGWSADGGLGIGAYQAQTQMGAGVGREIFGGSGGGRRDSGTASDDRYASRFEGGHVTEIGAKRSEGGGIERVRSDTNRSQSYVEKIPGTEENWDNGRLGNNERYVQPAPKEVQEQVMQSLKPAVAGVELADESNLKWAPSELQRYPLTYNPATHLLYIRRLPTGEVIQSLQERKEGNVDYEKHRLTRSFGPAAREINQEEVKRDLAAAKAALDVPVDVPVEGLSDEVREALKQRVVKDAWLFEPTLDSAWVIADLSRHKAKQNGVMPFIFHRQVKVAVPVVDWEDQTPFIEGLGEQTSFIELRMKLLEYGPRMNAQLWRLCEKRITDAVNRVLNQQLSLTLHIDSFLEDIGDLDTYLRDNYGDTVADAFAKNQEKVILTCFEVVPDHLEEQAAAFTSNYLAEHDFADDDAPIINYLVNGVTMTFVDCLSQELDIELNSKVGALITSSSPFMQSLAQDIMENIFQDDEFDRHFIRTKDGRVLEVTSGLIGTRSILIKLID